MNLFPPPLVVDLRFASLNTIFPHIRPMGIICLYGLQLRVLLELLNFAYIKVCLVRALLEMRVLFEGGPYMRKLGM